MADLPPGTLEPPWKGSQGSIADDLWRIAVGELEKRQSLGLAGLRELLEEKLEARDKAMELQAEKYEDRLIALNGEAARLREMKTELVGKESYDATLAQYDNWRRTVDQKLASLEGIHEKIERLSDRIGSLERQLGSFFGRVMGFTAAVSFIFALLSFAAKYIFK